MNQKQRALLITGFLLLAAVAFGKQQNTPQTPELQQAQSPSAPKPRGKSTPLSTFVCTQRLKTETDKNVLLSNKLAALQTESETWHSLANEMTVKQREAAAEVVQLLKENADLLKEQTELIRQQEKSSTNDHDRGLAQGMLLNEVSGTWTIKNGNSGTGGVCYVQVSHDSHTIFLSNCRY